VAQVRVLVGTRKGAFILLPDAVVQGTEPFLIVGAMAGG